MQPARVRVHSYAVWETVVFLLNVLAFLLMGMQARRIITEMPQAQLSQALTFAGIVVVAVIAVRLVWVFFYTRMATAFPVLRGDLAKVSWRPSLLVGWCGMRGLVTLATAFALPADFPQRDLIVLTAFGVVIATVVIQGMTITPLIKLLKIDGHQAQQNEFVRTRRSLAEAALAFLATIPASAEAGVTRVFELDRDAWSSDNPSPGAEQRRKLTLKALDVQRRSLTLLHERNEISEETFLVLQQELDWKQLSLSTADSDTIEET